MLEDQAKREKFILLVIMLISSIFALGCSIGGSSGKDSSDIRYDFCPGKYTINSSNQYNMFYYGVNQSMAQGLLLDNSKKEISGSAFNPPINYTDDKNWIADGYYIDSQNKYGIGTYTFKFSVKSETYFSSRNITWNNIPEWKRDTEFYFDGNRIKVINPGITSNEGLSGLNVAYRLKIYVVGGTGSQLFGQSSAVKEVTEMSYSLPRVTRSYTVVPVLAAEISSNKRMEMIMFYCPEQKFNIN